jgi:hypothetical protein
MEGGAVDRSAVLAVGNRQQLLLLDVSLSG